MKIDSFKICIIITLTILSLGLSIWALIIANVDSPLAFKDDKVITFAGLLFTIIGAVFAFYFVIIGIDANRKKEKIKELDDEIERKQSQIERFVTIEISQMDTMYGHLIEQAKTINDKKVRDAVEVSLRRDRSRLATQSTFLPKEKRLQRMSELGEKINNQLLGEATDIKDLEIIIKDKNEENDIIETAKNVKKQIEDGQ